MPQAGAPNAKKRERSGSPGPDRRETARFRVTDVTHGPVNPDGNRLHDDVTWTKQEDDRDIGPPRTQAMWLVKEGGFDTLSDIWWRPAVHFTKSLEAQFQAGIGYQQGEISYEDSYSAEQKVHYYAHDLRDGHQWVQRRYWDENRTKLRQESRSSV